MGGFPDSLLQVYNTLVPQPPASEFAVLTDKLLSFSRPDGGLPYYRGNSSSAEPTLLAALALFAVGAPEASSKPPLSFLRSLQNLDGSICVDAGKRDQGLWLTAPAAIAFHRLGLKDNLKNALDFILSVRSLTALNDPRLKQDNTLTGWPWVRGTFGWVEPTAWSVIALSLGGLGEHARTLEGRKLLLDRQIPSGGWNYGNPSLYDKELLPFWDTTGLALVALKDNSGAASLDRSLDLLDESQDKIESLRGLAWAVLGLQCHGRDTTKLRKRLLTVMKSMPEPEIDTANFSLGLIALSGKKVFAA